MKRFYRNALIFVCLILICATWVGAVTTLIPGGQVIGLQLEDGTVTVAGVVSSSSGLQTGDRLVSVNQVPTRSISDVRTALNGAATASVRLVRQGKTQTLEVPLTAGKLGVYLRQGTTGLGTVTYYNPQNNTFGALGHGVCKPDGSLTEMTAGAVYPVTLTGIKTGKIGAPGQLMGCIGPGQTVGQLEKNTRQGIFGKLTPTKAEPLPVGGKNGVKTGSATIYATVDADGLQEYSVEILKIYPNGGDTRNMVLKITDQRLLTATGGIVQGMSGSPIIQDGKLIGAVTHVLVNDPTTGYGIFIENMLNAA